ncbi:putative pumilio homolog 8, chloroplastic [Coffea eugenioides]|uniref:putative pumilio homolog 8, chloroplastic n=1 Tax=Coffea eugenioides TaxID=49369 RepID=UPI000F61268A|nr:putative pumilio homolog 8, chloroplastic [Coffea eugenioides]
MEHRGLGNRRIPYFPASYSPESQAQNFFMYPFRRNSLPEAGFDHPPPQTPNVFPCDQTLESALSRLNLSSDIHHQTAPFQPPETDTEGSMGYFRSVGLNNVGFEQGGLMGFDDYHTGGGPGGRQQQAFGFGGAHRNPFSGPGIWDCGPAISGFSGGICREPWCGDEASCLLNVDLKNDNSQRFCDHGNSFLQCKQSLSRGNQNGVSMENMDGLSNGFLSRNLSFLRPNSQNNRQLYARIKNQLDGLSLRDMRGRIVSFAKDQSGSKILQAKVDHANEGEIEMAISEILDHASDLMKNQSGSYFIQKLFVVCSEEQRTRIILAVTKNSFQLVDICLNPHGARTMQKLLENLSTPEQISFVISALSPGAVALANDPNGQHVIRYCLIHYPYEYHKHLLNEIVHNCYTIATDKSGCCVLQSCVENAYGEPKERLMNEIIRNALQLAEDPYGNYVVQHLLGLKIPEVTALLLEQLRGHFVALSSDKYASNVVEKILVDSGKGHSATVIMELLTSPNAGSLLVHPYGNFVIQKALSIAKGEVYVALHSLIQSNAQSMRSNLFGRKILAWFEKKKHQHV